MSTLTRLFASPSPHNQRNTLFTLVLAGFAALAVNMLLLLIDTTELGLRLGVPTALIQFVWSLLAAFGIISIHVLAVQRGLGKESALLRKEAEAELSRTRDRFVARVSHGLRTPLTGINGFAHLMRDAAEAPDEGFSPDEFVEPIIAEATDLRRMIDDLLASARLDAGTHESLIDDVSALEIVESAIRSTAPLGMGTVIETGDARLMADPADLRHVLKNLLVNAHRHGRGPVTIRSRVHGNSLLVEVVDNGRGISSDAEPWLFSTSPADRWSPSLGLGLDVAQQLCERMGAEISYRRIDRQTIFRVSVPLALSDPRNNQFASSGGYIRETLRRMGKIGTGRSDAPASK